MTEAQLTEMFPSTFIRQMIPHHRAAVQMSEKPSEIQGLRAFGENCGKYNHGTDKGYFRIGKSGKKMSEFRVIGLRSLPLRQRKRHYIM